MGLLRLTLALAVAIGHGRGWFGLSSTDALLGLHPVHPYYAVQMFFVVSGFYMALVFDRTYGALPGGKYIFWLNRAVRLLPAYWVVAAATLVAAWFLPGSQAYVVQAIHGACSPALTVHDVVVVAYLLLTNLTLLGQDLVEFVSLCNRPASGFLLVSQAWSVGMEIWFYLLTPWLVRFRTRWLLWLALASLAVRVGLATSDLPFYPWQQRFFPAEILFFTLGILAYRSRAYWLTVPHIMRAAGWCALVVILAVSGGMGWIFGPVDPSATVSVALGLLMFACVPPLFQLTAQWRLDSAIGELSYTIYLWHIFLGVFVWPMHADSTGIVYVVLMVALATLTVAFVERPANRWRHAQSRRIQSQHIVSAAPTGAKPAA